MNISKFGAEIIDYKPKMFEIVREGTQVSLLDDTMPNNFRTGAKIGNQTLWCMEDFARFIGVKFDDDEVASTSSKIVDFIA